MPHPDAIDQPPFDLDIFPSSDLPFYEEVLDWVNTKLRPAGFPKPLCKRLAVIITGLVASEKATIGEVTTAVQALAISKAKDESIARRLQRAFQDTRLDPSLLPLIFRPLLPELLHSYLLAHAANNGTLPFHHERFMGVVIILDESSKENEVHLLVGGIPFGGVVLPLAVRTWAQNVPLPDGEYWTQLTGLLQEIQQMLPAELRDHVLVTADRAYGVPRMLDILTALDWNWLVRVQGHTVIRLRNGQCHPLRSLVPKPGMLWRSSFSSKEATKEREAEAVGVFQSVGWRGSQVVAMWAEGQDEPWLLLTSLPARQERLVEYAQRWAIERLFLSWKSHGWDIEASGIHDHERLGRLLTVIAVSTFWRLAMALPTALNHLADLAARGSGYLHQLRLPGFAAPARPWAAKFSLLTWGAKVAHTARLAMHTPALCWRLPSWEGRSWEDICRDTCLAAHGQFSISL
jgi:hypothetical protein